MPSYAQASATVVYSPAVLATANKYVDQMLVPQAYYDNLFYGNCFGKPKQPGTEGRPATQLPSYRRPQRMTRGGTQAEAMVNFETASNLQAFYGGQQLNIRINQGGTKIFTPWAWYSGYAAMYRTDAAENSGEFKQWDLLKAILDQEWRGSMTTIETDLLSTNLDINHATGQNSLNGVQHWNSTSPSTGTQSGLDRSVYTPFRNQTGTVASAATGLIDGMEAMFYATAQFNGNKPCDVIWMDDTQHGYVVKQLQAVHRIVGSLDGGDLSTAKTLYFKGIPLVWHSLWAASRQDWFNNADMLAMVLSGQDWAEETPGKPNDIALAYEVRRYFAGAIMHRRPETNGVLTVSAA